MGFAHKVGVSNPLPLAESNTSRSQAGRALSVYDLRQWVVFKGTGNRVPFTCFHGGRVVRSSA